MTIKTRPNSEGPFPIHTLAALVPMATGAEQVALTADIKRNNQQEPIVLYKGAVVDGRCRMAALTLLEYDIKYKELDDNLTTLEVAVWVKSNNTRRQLTKTQLAFVAAKQFIEGGLNSSTREVAVSWAVAVASVTKAAWLIRNHPDIAQALFDGLNVNIVVNGNPRTTSAINAIYVYLKKKQEISIAELPAEYEGFVFTHEGAKEAFFRFHKEGIAFQEGLNITCERYDVIITELNAKIEMLERK